jgi:hypothetical protein
MIRPVRLGCEITLIRGTTDDQRDDEPSRALLEKSSDADLLREMIGFTAQRLMELEVEGLQQLPRPDLGDTRQHSGSAHP